MCVGLGPQCPYRILGAKQAAGGGGLVLAWIGPAASSSFFFLFVCLAVECEISISISLAGSSVFGDLHSPCIERKLWTDIGRPRVNSST